MNDLEKRLEILLKAYDIGWNERVYIIDQVLVDLEEFGYVQPKPDEGRLLSEEKLNGCASSEEQLSHFLAEPDDDVAASLDPKTKVLVARMVLLARNVSKAQDAQTASILEPQIKAECQARVKRIFDYLDRMVSVRRTSPEIAAIVSNLKNLQRINGW